MDAIGIVGEAFVLIRPETGPFIPELEAKLGATSLPGLLPSTNLTGPLTQDLAGAESAAASAAGKITKDIESIPAKAEPAANKTGQLLGNLANLFRNKASEITGSTSLVTQGVADLDKAGFAASSTIEGLGSSASAGFAAVGAAAAVLGGSALLAEKFGQQVFTLQSLIGSTSQEASQLNFALQANGVSSDTVGRALARFGRNLQNGTVDARVYGLEIAHQTNGNIDLFNTFLNLSDAMQRLGPGAQADALALQALGRGGTALIPILQQGRSAVIDLFNQTPNGLIFNDQQAKQAHDVSVQLKELKLDGEGLAAGLGKTLLPQLLDDTKALKGLVDEANRFHVVTTAFQIAGEAANPFLTTAKDFTRVWHDFFGGSDSAKKSLNELGPAATDTDAELQDLQESTKTLTDRLTAMGNAAGGVASAARSQSDANLAVIQSERDLATAQDAYNKLVATGGVDAQKAADATRALRDARNQLREANLAIADSEQSIHEKTLAVAEAESLFGVNSEEARKARNDLVDANGSLDSANSRVLDSQDAIAKAQKDAADATPGSTAATKNLSDAQDTLRTAQEKVGTAIENAAEQTANYGQKLAEADGITLTAQQKTLLLITALEQQAQTLSPDSPYRKNLQDTIDSLQFFLDKENDLAAQIASGTNAAASVLRGGPGSSLNGRGGPLETGAFTTSTQIYVFPAQGQSPLGIAQAIDAYQGGVVQGDPNSPTRRDSYANTGNAFPGLSP